MNKKITYSFLTKVKLAYWLVKTKLIWRNARIIRFPFDLRGRQFVDFGKGLTTGVGCRIEAFSDDGKRTMFFGCNVQINDYVHICSMKSVVIGDNVLMASRIYISDNSHGYYKETNQGTSPEIAPVKREYYLSPIIIEDNVWIGEGVVVLPGVTIGKGSVIGANSVVSKSISPYTIAVGQPAVAIKKYNFEKGIWLKIE